ncbi:hypothetical protein ColTof4_01882 [Colletotrichum tofieldiae]|nr:hypothetical protein ColTof3_09832 [Colletotrichum tofieldiae]GKT69459.1 hypothetical protein ColTof4_01882 [Colletotrichum tofieldiae]
MPDWDAEGDGDGFSPGIGPSWRLPREAPPGEIFLFEVETGRIAHSAEEVSGIGLMIIYAGAHGLDDGKSELYPPA